MAVNEPLRHSLEAEQAVLGSLLIDQDIIRDVMSAVREEDFQADVNRKLFHTAKALFRAGSAVDAVTIREKAGMEYSDYLLQLMEITPTSANWREYAGIMREKAVLNRAYGLARNLCDAGDLDACRKVYAQLGQLLSDGRKLDAWSVAQLLDSFFESQDPDAPRPEYISFGLDLLDQGTYIEPGDVVVIGGYPSDGKTALSLMMAWHMAKQYRVGFFSLETDRKKLRDRLIAHAAQLDLADIKRRGLSEKAWEDLAREQVGFAKRDLTLVEAAGMRASDIEAASRAYGFRVIFVDYVQLVTPEPCSTRSEQMAGVSRALHTFAQKTGTLVVELAQLSRQEKSKDSARREPTMHDLKESGQFEQDADMILLLFRPGPRDKGPDGTPFREEDHRMLKIAKNKEGRWGTWPLYFDGGTQTFVPVTDSMGVMRKLQAEGRKAKARNRREASGQVTFTELPEGDAEMPF